MAAITSRRMSSAKGLLALLMETDTSVLHFALSRLNACVDEFWYELSTQLPLVEELTDSDSLPEMTRQQAALLASRTYFHLTALDDSVQFALRAGAMFNEACTARSNYTDTILGRCIDMYVAHRESKSEEPLDERLSAMFETLANTWIGAGSDVIHVKDMVGFTLRARRVDLLRNVLNAEIAASASGALIGFALRCANKFVIDITFRTEVLRTLADLYTSGLNDVDYFALVDCLLFLNDSDTVGRLIKELLVKDKLTAYQIGFDLFETANQEFLQAVTAVVTKDELSPAVEGDAAAASSTPSEPTHIADILLGNITTNLNVKFLYTACRADVQVLNTTKKVIPPKVAVLQTATIMSSGFMYAGTTIDGFLRDNLQWLAKVTNWAKFTATATVGVVHKGHVEEAMKILQPYLPTSNNVGELPFQEAGALFALGLIHAGLGSGCKESKDAVVYLRDALRQYSSNEQMVHGASLGLGLAAMGLNDEALFDALFVCVNGCDAVPGEGAAIGIGLVMLGSAHESSTEMLLASAREVDQKEKTIRGLSSALALMHLGKEGIADALWQDMVNDRDHWIRAGGCQVIGLAYAGSTNSKAIEALLQVCVKDVSDEVRRAAITMIGFVCLADVDQCLKLTRVFADSYNPHVRYGVAMALGIAGAGSGDATVISRLWLLKDDPTDFVRQGAILALSMVLVQQPGGVEPRAEEFRTYLSTKVADGKCDHCTKFGCILAQGIMDFGGRNATLALHHNKHRNNRAVIGAFLFLQHWHWFPFAYMLSLAMQPTCIIGLNERLDMPEYSMKSNAPPSRFASAKPLTRKEIKAQEEKKVAVLSTTQRQADLKAKKRGQGSQVNSPTMAKAPSMPTDGEDAPKDATDAAKKPEEEKEPDHETLQNPARIVFAQLGSIEHNDTRYRPLHKEPKPGVCMLRDYTPGEPEKIVAVNLRDGKDDVAPPEPFEWP